ncbi:MAG TPA: hypothetical protein VMU09_11780, partial [Acidimicrobiales bacterium]|nr:hypothetical protein [Acidimicrobiales bacterium]
MTVAPQIPTEAEAPPPVAETGKAAKKGKGDKPAKNGGQEPAEAGTGVAPDAPSPVIRPQDQAEIMLEDT